MLFGETTNDLKNNTVYRPGNFLAEEIFQNAKREQS